MLFLQFQHIKNAYLRVFLTFSVYEKCRTSIFGQPGRTIFDFHRKPRILRYHYTQVNKNRQRKRQYFSNFKRISKLQVYFQTTKIGKEKEKEGHGTFT